MGEIATAIIGDLAITRGIATRAGVKFSRDDLPLPADHCPRVSSMAQSILTAAGHCRDSWVVPTIGEMKIDYLALARLRGCN